MFIVESRNLHNDIYVWRCNATGAFSGIMEPLTVSASSTPPAPTHFEPNSPVTDEFNYRVIAICNSVAR